MICVLTILQNLGLFTWLVFESFYVCLCALHACEVIQTGTIRRLQKEDQYLHS
ncbi:hypothetical protein Fmac_022978 [Flemingia macrophylla]|uniref:Uncharacterized protein n=1 Tax=Flemingia macrophylla TaxID=520843 RepID=A0ABD1LK74_9FABA